MELSSPPPSPIGLPPPVTTFELCLGAFTNASYAASLLNWKGSPRGNYSTLVHLHYNDLYDSMLVPYVIAQPWTAQDVAALVVCANNANLRYVIRGGGHSYTQLNTINKGLIIDLTNLAEITVAPASTPGGQAVAWIGGGQKLGPIYVATLAKDLYLPGGTCPPVGIGGHAQGGGRGMAHRGLGMLIDHALSVEVVTTDGRVLNASATNQYSDLFWAVRGGGANYGVVTRWQMRLDPVPESVTRFTLSWNTTVANLATALLALDKWAPWNLSSSWGRVHFNIMPSSIDFQLFYFKYPNDTIPDGDALLATFPPTATKPSNGGGPYHWETFEDYVIESANIYPRDKVPELFPENISSIAATRNMDRFIMGELTEAKVSGGSVIIQQAITNKTAWEFASVTVPQLMKSNRSANVWGTVYGGKLRDLPLNATAFPWRYANLELGPITKVFDMEDAQWVQRLHAVWQPVAQGSRYWNYLECLSASADPWTSYFGQHAQQLRAIKAKYDPLGLINALDCDALLNPDAELQDWLKKKKRRLAEL